MAKTKTPGPGKAKQSENPEKPVKAKAGAPGAAPEGAALGEARGGAVGEAVGEAVGGAAATALRLGELVARVEAATGVKRKTLKPAAEALLHEIGAALARGESFNLPGLGRGRVTRSAEKAGATVLTLKLRQDLEKNLAQGGKQPLADAGEDG